MAMNAFDGILPIIGVLMGSLLAGIADPRLVLFTGLATCLSIGVSGFSGAYMTEVAERNRALQELETVMLRDMKGSRQARAHRFAVIAVAVVAGLSPVVAGMLVLGPWILNGAIGSIAFAYAASLAIALAMLFGLGVLLGRLSKQNLILSGMRMLVAGLACVGLSVLLNVAG